MISAVRKDSGNEILLQTHTWYITASSSMYITVGKKTTDPRSESNEHSYSEEAQTPGPGSQSRIFPANFSLSWT